MTTAPGPWSPTRAPCVNQYPGVAETPYSAVASIAAAPSPKPSSPTSSTDPRPALVIEDTQFGRDFMEAGGDLSATFTRAIRSCMRNPKTAGWCKCGRGSWARRPRRRPPVDEHYVPPPVQPRPLHHTRIADRGVLVVLLRWRAQEVHLRRQYSQTSRGSICQ